MPGEPPLANLLKMVAAGEKLSAAEENLLRQLATRTVDLPDALVDSRGIRQARPAPDESEDELYWCILVEAHPGRGRCFNMLIGTWCPSEHKFRFDCDATEYEIGIDWHYGVPYPTEAGARGWFKRMTSNWTDSGYIYVCVSLDCESPGACDGDYDTGGDSIPCLTPETDPCEEGS